MATVVNANSACRLSREALYHYFLGLILPDSGSKRVFTYLLQQCFPLSHPGVDFCKPVSSVFPKTLHPTAGMLFFSKVFVIIVTLPRVQRV